jgi:hypothetical protein
MKKISADEFYRMVLGNLSIFKTLETPLEVTEYLNCKITEITHLSQYLTFSGRNKDGEVGDFSSCRNLKVATGTFNGLVDFSGSGIERIENLHITQGNWEGNAACFHGCKSLKIATGNYRGCVDFQHSGIHSIQNLHIKHGNSDGVFAEFKDCSNLKTLEGWDLSQRIWIEKEKIEEEIKRRQSLKRFHTETQIPKLPFL